MNFPSHIFTKQFPTPGFHNEVTVKVSNKLGFRKIASLAYSPIPFCPVFHFPWIPLLIYMCLETIIGLYTVHVVPCSFVDFLI